MAASNSHTAHSLKVLDTEIPAGVVRQQFREKIARITLDALVQFAGLPDVRGTVLEISHVALKLQLLQGSV